MSETAHATETCSQNEEDQKDRAGVLADGKDEEEEEDEDNIIAEVYKTKAVAVSTNKALTSKFRGEGCGSSQRRLAEGLM